MGMLDAFSRSYLTPAVFSTRALAALERLTSDEFLQREGDGTKRLIEEVVPIASFLKRFEVPSRRVRCRYFQLNQNYDAKLRLSGDEVDRGFLESQYFVEVTSAVSPKDYLKREALTRDGGVFGGDEIERIGSRRRGDDRIESRAVARDGDAFLREAAEWTREALSKKQAKTYPTPCILLVRVEPEKYPSIGEWSSFAAQVRDAVDRERFAYTYVVHPWTNMVFAV